MVPKSKSSFLPNFCFFRAGNLSFPPCIKRTGERAYYNHKPTGRNAMKSITARVPKCRCRKTKKLKFQEIIWMDL